MPTEPIPPHVARAAVHWLLALDGGDDEGARQQWQAWLAADPLHARAWQRIAEVDGQLRSVPTPLALQTLAAPGLGRRHAVRLAVLLTAGAGGLLAARQTSTWQQLAADLSTATGERRETVLADGTRIQLNTASAVDVRYSAAERLIVLRAGEILVRSAPDAARRPLRVRTAEGTVRAIGTRFTVRQQGGQTAVAVLEGAVELTPMHAPHAAQRLSAGEQSRFTATAASPPAPLQDGAAAWADGMLVADGMPLPDFLAELGRHRPGVLRCAPDAADLRVSGTYPLADTDRVLAALTLSLPVQVRSRTRWWVVVERRG
ncbi:FecR domain-containing protein [Acidovorax sp. YS12]|nr:FecR domain-containing protein [Acidovorax sp. YS12]